MTPRTLVDAALEAQAQRVIDARPRDLMGGGAHTGRCRLCDGLLGTPNGSGRRNVSGYCTRTQECRNMQHRVRRGPPKPRPIKIVPPALPPQFCGHCNTRLDVHGRRTTSGYCRRGPCRYQRVLEIKAHRLAAKVGAMAQNGKEA